jgi:hypothetical protein
MCLRLQTTADSRGSSFYDSNLQNFYDLKRKRALASFDIPQTLVVSYIYELPFGPGKPFLNQNGSSPKRIREISQ